MLITTVSKGCHTLRQCTAEGKNYVYTARIKVLIYELEYSKTKSPLIFFLSILTANGRFL